MTRLDQNRAVSQLAQKAGRPISSVSNVTIWGNHSATQYPDFYNAKIDGKPVTESISDTNWLQTTFIDVVQKRGAAVIKARGASSAASAANAIIGNVQDIWFPTAAGQSFSSAICSDGSYGIDAGLIASLPLTSDGKTWKVVKDLPLNDFAKDKIAKTVAELRAERDCVKDLLPS
jgi:malate dehydrogenase